MNQPSGDLPPQAYGIYEDALRKLVKEHALAVDGLTEIQLVECIRQAILCGDFVRYVAMPYNAIPDQDLPPVALSAIHKQSVVYIPFRDREQLLARIKELENKIELLHDEM